MLEPDLVITCIDCGGRAFLLTKPPRGRRVVARRHRRLPLPGLPRPLGPRPPRPRRRRKLKTPRTVCFIRRHGQSEADSCGDVQDLALRTWRGRLRPRSVNSSSSSSASTGWSASVGSASTISNAASRASSTSSRSRRSDASLRSLRPFCDGRHQRALAAQLEVDLGQLEPVGRGDQRLDPRVRRRLLGRRLRDQPAARRVRAAPDPAAQLVQLGDAEPVGVEDHHHRGVGDVDADLDHGGGDEHVELAGAEQVHRHLLLGRRQPAVQQPEPEPRQLAGGEPLVGLLGRRHLELLALVDQRAHDVGLAPGRRPRRARRPTPPPRAADPVRPLGHDRRAARRQLVEHAHVEVAVDGHRRRPRDRRRRHHQHVGHVRRTTCRAAPPAARHRTGAARRRRPRRGCGTRHPPGSARACRSRCRPSRRRGRPAPPARSAPVTRLVSSSTRSGRSPNRLSGSGTARSPSRRLHAGGVLLGEHLGRRHQRALVAALHRRAATSTRRPRSCRTPTSPCSNRCIGCGAARSALDLGDHPLLGAGERVRQGVVEAPHQLAVDGVATDRATSRSSCPLAHHQHELHTEQLVERQPPAGRLLVAHRLGEVDRAQRHRRARPGRAAGGPRRAPGRRCPRSWQRRSASSIQPASSHVLSWAFSLCG